MGKLTLILGGARSGKSSYAEKQAKELGGDNVLYVATSQTKDDEMEERVEKHRTDRPSAWATLEAPRNVAQALGRERHAEVILLDCVTFLVANHLMDASAPEDDPFGDPKTDPFAQEIEAAVVAEVESLIEFVKENDVELLAVSNEVGLGLVPAYELGRAYRDILGRANQILAHHADEAIFFVAGLPVKVK